MSRDLLYRGNERQQDEPAPPIPGSGTGPIRRSIVDVARTFVRDAHYLEGTAGNTPGFADGNPGGDKKSACKLLQPSLNTDPKETRFGVVIAVNTAGQNQFNGINSCAGRSGLIGQAGRYQPQPTDRDLQDYLQRVRGLLITQDQVLWPGHPPHNLHPRRYFLKNEIQQQGKILWGESCAGRRHFDCVGLVNFCYEEHTDRPGGWGFEIRQYFESTITGTFPVSPSQVTDGDIVVRLTPHEHIGLLFRAGNVFRVVQAADTETGLTDRDVYIPTEWAKVVRVRDTFLRKRQRKLRDGNGN